MESPISTEVKTFKNDAMIDTFRLFNNDENADVKFVFDSNVEIPAHKLILAMNSLVFRSMFFGELKEMGNIKIVDSSVAAFIEFLQFFYLNEVKLTGENVAEVMYLANKYNVNACMKGCINYFKQILVDENTCSVYALAVMYDQKDLMEYCEERMICNPESIFRTSSFKCCHRDILKRILTLNLRCRELLVFMECMDWAKQACERANIDGSNTDNCKTQLGDCFQLIRFPTMSTIEFASALKNHRSLFNIETLADIVVHIGLKTPLQQATNFSTIRRWRILTCIRECDNDVPYKHTIQQREVVQFSTNKRIVLEGIRMNDIIHPLIKTKLTGDINISVVNSESINELLLNQPVILLDAIANCYDLHKPIIINPHWKYEIELAFFGQISRFVYPVSVKRYANTVSLDDGIEFTFHSSSDVKYDCVQFGLIAALRFLPL